MRSLFVVALTAASAFVVTAAPSTAQAQDFAYCLQGEEWGYPGHCQFASLAECQATASGTSADCGLNPRVAFGVARPYGAYAGMRPGDGAYAYSPADPRGRW